MIIFDLMVMVNTKNVAENRCKVAVNSSLASKAMYNMPYFFLKLNEVNSNVAINLTREHFLCTAEVKSTFW